MANDIRMFEIRGDWRAAASAPRAWWSIVNEGASRGSWLYGARKKRVQPKTARGREAEKADEVGIAPR